MSTVRDLIPGNIVDLPGGSATFVSATDHPLYPGLQLVTWRLANGEWSHDALHRDQHVGYARAVTLDQLHDALRRALLAPTNPTTPPALTKPQVVDSVDGLEALPVGAVVRHESQEPVVYEDGSWEQGAIAEKRIDRSGSPSWFLVGRHLGYRSHQADILPATVLYTPPASLPETQS